MTTARDVAAYILHRSSTPMSTMKLQKLVYYSQAWSLVWDEQPLFDDPIEAWANGPVIPSLFQAHKGRFQVSPGDVPGRDNLTPEQRETINAILDGYGDLTGQELSDLSHTERPWREARGDTTTGARSSAVIDLEGMQEYYSASLMQA